VAELLDQIAIFMEDLILSIGYLGIIAIMLAENIFPPIPTDPLLPFAGILAARGELNFFGVWLSAVFGALVGSSMLYLLGRWADERVVRGVIRRYGRYIAVSERELDRSLELFRRYGAPLVIVGRAIPVIRATISITAGISRMKLWQFLLYSGINSAAVTGFWIFVGYQLGENWRDIVDGVRRYQTAFLIGVAVAVVVFVAVYVRRRGQKRRAVISAGQNLSEG
jgi:membrane protein DedA with SNARE-associated domain